MINSVDQSHRVEAASGRVEILYVPLGDARSANEFTEVKRPVTKRARMSSVSEEKKIMSRGKSTAFGSDKIAGLGGKQSSSGLTRYPAYLTT